MRNTVSLVATVVLMAPHPAHGQVERVNARVLEAVAVARVEHLNDSTAFERCHVRALIGDERRLPFIEGDLLPRRIEVGPVECSGDGRSPGTPRHTVIVDSVTVGDSVAVAYLDVRRGELVHHERHTLIPVRGSDRWLAREITLSNPGRIYFHDPRGRQQTASGRNRLDSNLPALHAH